MWVLTSTSGAAALSREARLAHWQELAGRLTGTARLAEGGRQRAEGCRGLMQRGGISGEGDGAAAGLADEGAYNLFPRGTATVGLRRVLGDWWTTSLPMVSRASLHGTAMPGCW